MVETLQSWSRKFCLFLIENAIVRKLLKNAVHEKCCWAECVTLTLSDDYRTAALHVSPGSLATPPAVGLKRQLEARRKLTLGQHRMAGRLKPSSTLKLCVCYQQTRTACYQQSDLKVPGNTLIFCCRCCLGIGSLLTLLTRAIQLARPGSVQRCASTRQRRGLQ